MKYKNIKHKKRDFNSNLNAAKIVSAFILSLFILTAGLFGIMDFITPNHVAAFNINDLNKNGVIIYSKTDYGILDLFSFLSHSSNSANDSHNTESLKNDNAATAFNNSALSPYVSSSSAQTDNLSISNSNNNGESIYTAKLFGIIPIKKVQVSLFPETELIPGGMPFGVKFLTQGVIVVGLSDIETEKGTVNPAKNAGIKTSDIVTEINGVTVNSVEEATNIIEGSNGDTMDLTVTRDGKTYDLKLKPAFSVSDNKYKLGIWLRDSTAGIGTVTFINPSNNAFGGLGHGICDVDTGNLMPLRKGTIVDSVIDSVVKGKSELPGELKGKFKENMGTLLSNTQNGIFGILSNMPVSPEDATPIPIGLRSDVKEGRATIYCTIDGTGPQEYEIDILKIYKNSTDSKNFLIKITDPNLIEATGGIVQGMSGSPIMQNGKIIGAVTHVLVSDPTKGYGIFIDNMLSAMPEILK